MIEKIRPILFLKGVGILGVVAHHIANRRFDEYSRGWIGLLAACMEWAVPLFIVISGYLHGVSSCGRISEFGSFVWGRFFRLLVPFFLFTFLYSIAYGFVVYSGLLCDPAGQVAVWYDVWGRSLLGVPGGVGEQLYFLPLLFIIMFFSALVISLVGRRADFLAFSICVFISLGVGWGVAEVWLFKVYWPVHQILIGVGLYLCGFVLASRPKWVGFFCGCSALISALLIGFGRSDMANLLFAVVLLTAAIYLNWSQRGVNILGEASGTIFLYHTPFVLQPMLVLLTRELPVRFHVGGAYFIMFMVIFLLSLVHVVLIKSPLRKMAF